MLNFGARLCVNQLCMYLFIYFLGTGFLFCFFFQEVEFSIVRITVPVFSSKYIFIKSEKIIMKQCFTQSLLLTKDAKSSSTISGHAKNLVINNRYNTIYVEQMRSRPRTYRNLFLLSFDWRIY